MRIGIFTDTYYPIISGVVTSVMTLESELIALGHEVYIFTTDMNERIPNKNNIIYFSGVKVPLESLKSFRLSFRLHVKVREIKKYNLDVIHIQTEFSMARLAVLASKKYHIPLVYTLHTLYEDYLQYISKTIDKHFHKKFLSSLAAILVSPINKQAIVKIVPTRKVLAHVGKYHLDGDIRVVPTGLDFNKLLLKKEENNKIAELKKKLKIPDDNLVFLSIGRISEEKSLDVIIRAFANIDNSKAKLVIAGDGPALESLKNLVSELKIEDSVRFLGFVEWEKIVPYYQLGDVFLNASVTETQGLTYLESLICGTPLLVQQDECLEGILINGKNGFYFNGENDLIIKMKEIIENPSKIRQLKDTTCDTVLNYTKENFASQILNIYLGAIERSKIKTNKFFTGLKK